MTTLHLSRTRAAAALLCLGFLADGASLVPAPAHAQVYYQPGPAIGEHRLLRQLKGLGYRNISVPVLNRDVFVLDATSARGEPVRLIVSAFDGRILESHPQRRQWTRIDPDDEDLWPDRRWRRHDPRWNNPVDIDPALRRRPGHDWPGDDDVWTRRDDLDEPERREETDPPAPPAEIAPRRTPERVTVAPPPPAVAPRDPDLPAPTLKNPTIVRRSPTAIPKDPGEMALPRAPAISTAPPPGAGTRDKPRIIDMSPKVPGVEPKRAGASPAAPAPSATPPAATAQRDRGAAPAAGLESLAAPPQPAPPQIAPATPE